jgi:hypothetical protein
VGSGCGLDPLRWGNDGAADNIPDPSFAGTFERPGG